MPIVPIYDVGKVGIVDDVPPESLPPEAWTYGKNVRFVDDHVEKLGGYNTVFGTPGVTDPQHLLHHPVPGAPYWVYATLTKLRTFDGASHNDVTRSVGGDYGANAIDKWQGTILGNRVIMNNGFDVPQAQATLVPNSLFADLSAWDPLWRTKDIQSYRNFLVALNVTKNSVAFPHMVKWSHPADPGSLPVSWDETDPSYLAGEVALLETPGACVTQRVLRDLNVIYKEDSVWGMQFIGGQFVFRFYPMFPNIDILGPKAVDTFAQQHIVLGNNGLYVHDGQNQQQILTKRRRRWLYNTLHQNEFKKTIVVRHEIKDEIWIIFPDQTAGNPNRALIWNYADNTFTDTVIEESNHVAVGQFLDDFANAQWDQQPTVPWQNENAIWDQGAASSLDNGLFSAVAGDTFRRLDYGITQNGGGFDAEVLRQGLVIVGRDWRGQPKVDVSKIKHVRAIYPKISNIGAGALVKVYCGGQMHRDDPIAWQGPFDFNPATMDKVDFSVNGRYIAVRFVVTGTDSFHLHSYDMDIDVAGIY